MLLVKGDHFKIEAVYQSLHEIEIVQFDWNI